MRSIVYPSQAVARTLVISSEVRNLLVAAQANSRFLVAALLSMTSRGITKARKVK